MKYRHLIQRLFLFCLITLLLLNLECKKNPTDADNEELCDYVSASGYSFPNCSSGELTESLIMYNSVGQRIAWEFKVTCSPSGKTYTGRVYDIKYYGDEIMYYKVEINGQSCSYGTPPSFTTNDLTGKWGNNIFDIQVDTQGNISGNNINSTLQIDQNGVITGNGTITFIGTGGELTKNITWNLEMSWDKQAISGSMIIDYPGYENMWVIFDRNTSPSWPLWQIQSSPTFNSLRGVAFADSMTGVAVGDAGTIIRTVDRGETWSVVNSNTSYHLYGIHFINENTGIIVGRFGTILRTTDAGLTWQRGDSLTDKRLKDVHFSGEQNGIIAGWEILLRSGNGGINWTDVSNGLIYSNLEDVNGGFAVGSSGTIIRYTTSAWEQLPGVTNTPLNGITVSPFFSVVAVGGSYSNGGIIMSSNNYGSTWITIEDQNIPVLNAIAEHYSYSTTTTQKISVGENGTILTMFGENFWIFQNSDTQEILNDMAFAGDRAAIAVGDYGTILRLFKP